MSKTRQEQIIEEIKRKLSTDNKSDDHSDAGKSLTLGVVVDTDDPLQMGRLRIFCGSLGDNPSKIDQLPWASYVSPFAGSINNSTYTREDQTSEGAVSYGWWAIPDLGAKVLVGCVDGDLRKRFWMGAMYEQQETNTLFNGRFYYKEDGSLDGPLTSGKKPIEPNYSNAKESFNNNEKSPEWKTRVGDYQASRVTKAPSPDKKSYVDQTKEEMQSREDFEFDRDKIGDEGYSYSSFRDLPVKSSKVFGFVTPGFHSITFDDRDYNSRIKIRTSSGHMFLLDDTNERIYIKTSKGKSWIELDANGNGDFYFDKRLSFRAKDDVNITSDKTLRLMGKEGVYIYAGDENGLPELTSNPAIGQVRIQSQDDMHLVSKNLRQLSFKDTISEIGGDNCKTVAGSIYTQVQHDINFVTNDGDMNMTVSGDMNIEVLKKYGMFSIGGALFSSQGDVQVYSFAGSMKVGGQTDLTFKSISGNLNFQSVGMNGSGSGSIRMKTPNSQINLSDAGGTISTNGNLAIQSGGDLKVQSNSPSNQNQPIPSGSGGSGSPGTVPDITCNLGTSVPIAGYTGADLCARCAYNAGFRGQALVTAVAIASAESSYDPNNIGDTALETNVWGPSCGFWQIRTLQHPELYTGVDRERDINSIFDPQYNANVAYELSASGTNFGPWSTYMDGAYLDSQNLNSAITAVNNLCNPTQTAQNILMGEMDKPLESSNDLMGATLGGILPSIHLSKTGLSMQSPTDISMISIGRGYGTTAFAGLNDKVNEVALQLDTLAYYTSTAMAILQSATNTSLNFPVDASTIMSLVPIPSQFTTVLELVDTGERLSLSAIEPELFNYLQSSAEQLFNSENFQINGKTIIL